MADPVSKADLGRLPPRSVAAYAVRCARRVRPLYSSCDGEHDAALDTAIEIAERFAAGGRIPAWAEVATALGAARQARAAAERALDEAVLDAGAPDKAPEPLAVEAARRSRCAAASAAAAVSAAAHAAAHGAAVDDAFLAGSSAEAAAPEAQTAAQRDFVRLLRLSTHRATRRPARQFGDPIDPGEQGPLGPLWPEGRPAWSKVDKPGRDYVLRGEPVRAAPPTSRASAPTRGRHPRRGRQPASPQDGGDLAPGDPRLAAVAAQGRGAFGPSAGVQRDPVDCTVFSPPEVRAEDSLLVQVFAHVPQKAEEADLLAREFDEATQRRGVTSLGTQIARGSKLSVELTIRNLTVCDPVQDLTWRGRTEAVQFEVAVPVDCRPQTVIGTALISQDTVPIGQVRFKLKVVGERANVATEAAPAGRATRYAKAFVSYASKDRSQVFPRVQMLPAVGIQFFQDVLSLDPGDRWANKLYEYIDESDVLFLFWSTAAKQSEWVEREWRYGLERKGDDFIRPVIIEGPPGPAPPPDLAHLHFSDKMLYFVHAQRGRLSC